MSDNEQHDPTPQLTRRQLRELRDTASNPIITDETLAQAAETGADPAPTPPPSAPPSAPLPRAAEPVAVADPSVSEASIDLGARALTRRQARQQEKIRTASMPIISPDLLQPAEPAAPVTREASESVPAEADGALRPAAAEPADGPASEEIATPPASDEPSTDGRDDDSHLEHSAEPDEAPTGAAVEIAGSDDDASHATTSHATTGDADGEDIASLGLADRDETSTDEQPPADDASPSDDESEPERHVVSEELGAALLARSSTESAELPSSFDQLLSRSAAATGAFTAPSALILTQSPDAGPLVAPVTATGEVLITGTFALPDRFGSTGVVPGSADGSEADAVLVDGELPASSSPTPIAASAAISTIKSAEDVIRPPAPEKGGRTMIFLAITAGVLAAALAGVLVVGLFTGVLSS